MQYRLDERTATLPLFSFWKNQRPASALRKVTVDGRVSELFIAAPECHGIPYAADFLVFRALGALMHSGRYSAGMNGYFEIRIADVCSAIGNPDAEVAKSVLRLANTVYELKNTNWEVETFKILEAERKSSRSFLVRFPEDRGFSPVSVAWSTFRKFKDPTAARLFELVTFARWKRHGSVSFFLEEMALSIPFDSGYMNRSYVRRAAESVAGTWLASFSNPEKSVFSFVFPEEGDSRPVPRRSVWSPTAKRASGHSSDKLRGLTIDSEMPKTDIFLRKALLEAYWYKCFYTRDPIDLGTLTVDHVVPVSRWGRNCISNYVPVTKSANSSKNDRYVESDARELVAVVRAVYARKVLEKYVSIRSSFYSAPIRA